MKKGLFFLFLGMSFLGGALFWWGRQATLKKETSVAALQVSATPAATVFLNEQNLGKTPFYSEKLKPGEYTLKLVAEEGTKAATWQGKVKLTGRVLTAVNQRLVSDDLFSSGEVLTLESLKNKEGTEIAVFSNPDGALVQLNDEEKGVTPLIIKNVPASDHRLLVSYPGYQDESLRLKTNKGYRLLANVKLSFLPKDKREETATTSAQIPGPKVKILTTPTGWLRVRTEPSLSASEAAKVKPGESYFLLEEKPGWLKIQYEEKKEGWVSSQYAEKE